MRTFLCGVAAIGLLTAVAWADEKKEKPAAHHQDPPGPVHKQLAKQAGEYTTVTKFRSSPDGDVEETKGKARLMSILGGRFLHEENSGIMHGEPYTGARLIGYNNASKKFEAIWIYTGATGQMRLVGNSKDDGKTIQWTATVDMGKGGKMTLYAVTRHIDDNHFAVELSMKGDDGKKGASFETTYTRKK
jgi:hypothetical protein